MDYQRYTHVYAHLVSSELTHLRNHAWKEMETEILYKTLATYYPVVRRKDCGRVTDGG